MHYRSNVALAMDLRSRSVSCTAKGQCCQPREVSQGEEEKAKQLRPKIGLFQTVRWYTNSEHGTRQSK